MTGYRRWPVAFSCYADDNSTNPVFTITGTSITLANDNETHMISNYVGSSIDDIIAELNGNLAEFKVVKNIDIGAERITASSLVTDGSIDYLEPDSPLTCRYLGVISRATERSVIQLKEPRSASPFESWYPRIGRGKFRTRFSDVNFQNYPGIDPNTVYEFSVKEFDIQDWSPHYGPPYKDVQGEIPSIVSYHPAIQATVIRVSRTPLLWKNKNISILIRGVRQPNSIIKYVDENNGLIYLNQKIGRRTNLSVDYTHKELDYVYDAIDLNASIAHNPLVVDTYVAFYLKPSSAEGSLISGGSSVFHEVTTSEAAARARIARIIPETKGTGNPKYEPVIFLGSLNVRQGSSYDDFEIIDTRSRGGGLYEKEADSISKSWRESEFFLDIGNIDGIDVPGNAAVVITLPTGEYTNLMDSDEIVQRATKDVAMGVVPIVDYYQSPTSYTDSLVFGDDQLTVTMNSMSPSVTLNKLEKTGEGYVRDFYPTEIFRLKLEDSTLEESVSNVFLYDEYSPLPSYGDLDAPFDVGADDFEHKEIRNYGERVEIHYSSLMVGDQTFSSYKVIVYGNVVDGIARWNIEVFPSGQSTYRLRAVEFPRFHANRVNDVNSITFIPNRGGIVSVDSHNNQKTGYTVFNPGVGFEQWCDYSPNTPASGQLSWRTEDVHHRFKAYKHIPSSTGIGIHSVAHCLNLDQEMVDYHSSFETVMTVKSGDWYDSIADYREWLESSKLSNVPKLTDTGSDNYIYPEYITDVSFKAQYQPGNTQFHPFAGTGDFDNWTIMADDAQRLKTYLQPNTGHFIVRTDGYHFNDFDTSWPDMTPIDSTFSGAIHQMNTGMTGVTVCPYSNFFYFPETTGASPYARQYTRNRDQTDVIANGLIAGAITYSFQDPTLRAAMIQPWLDMMAMVGCNGIYSDLWGGLTPYGDFSDILPDSERGNYEKISEAGVQTHRDLAISFNKTNGEYPLIFTENIGPEFVGVDAMMLHRDTPGGSQTMGELFQGGNAYMVPAWNTIYGEYSLVSQTTPSLGTVSTPGGMESILRYQEWNMHYGKIPSMAAAWTGQAQVEITVPVDTGSPVGLWIPENWDFAKLMIDQHYHMGKYCYHGRRLRPTDHSAEIIASATVGYQNGYTSLWQGPDHVGAINSWSSTGAGGADITIDAVKYPELADKTGFWEITSGVNTYISDYNHSGTFTYAIADYDSFGLRVFEFRG